MKARHDVLLVKSPTPPTVEVDFDAAAVYVRFRRSKVARTIVRPSGRCIVTVDLDKAGNVVGVEAIGETEVQIGRILRLASVEAPNVDFSRVRYTRPQAYAGMQAVA
jgi:uncharacterized protein YuzE